MHARNWQLTADNFRAAMLVGLFAVLVPGWTARAEVRAWEDRLVIPTYQIGKPDPNPIFYSNESYQGAQKRVYPYALQDQLSTTRQDRSYIALNLENEYIRLTILPELGGRLFAATDKTNNYDFIYRQHVIKPALIGMLGAWISGGIEWCAFHHHRATTFMPVDYVIVANAEGSKTIWVGETERRHRMKWLVGLTLRPGSSYIQATVKFFNRTAQPHSILYWANVAVHVDENYQVIFPPSVQVATYHSKTDFTYWPIAQGRYRGSNYAGRDISWWKNSSSSNSFFAWDLAENFMGGYDHGKQAGVVHVADHHIVCGAKLWEWGTGLSGRMWDKKLTDTDGPYAELMVGAWSDNQPDYSWIKPYEVKVHTQYWYPVRAIGGFKNVNLNGAVNLELRPGNVARFGFHTTARHEGARAILKAGQRTVAQEVVEIGPDKPFVKEATVPEGTKATELRAELIGADGKELIAYQPIERKAPERLPKPVQTPPRPQDIKTIEEVYLTGRRIEQIHNPRVSPLDYYREALRRDAGDSRSNVAMGSDRNRRGMYEEAQQHLERAVERISAEYTRPGDTEAYYQVGLSLRGQGKFDGARDAFYRASWDAGFHGAAYAQLAELSCRDGAYAQALGNVDESISVNQRNTKLLCIKAAILRKLGRANEASDTARRALEIDPLDFFAMNELAWAQRASGAAADGVLADLRAKMRDEVQAYLELAADYMGCGLWDDAIEVLRRPVDAKTQFAGAYPLVHYYLGWLNERKGDKQRALEAYARGASAPSDYCFPFRLESMDVLLSAIKADSRDARAYYYLGNLLYDLQPESAVAYWEKSRAIDGGFALVHRNLGWAHKRGRSNIGAAIESYEKAIACSATDPRFFLELDALYEMGNIAPETRLAMLQKNHAVVAQRQDSLLREIMVLLLAGQYERALDYLANNYFHAREGAEGIRDVYVDAHLLRGQELMRGQRFAEALGHFQRASEYPENLSIGRASYDRRAAQIAFFSGSALEGMGDKKKAREVWQLGANAQSGFGDLDMQYYQAMCLVKLGENDRAARLFQNLLGSATSRLAQAEDPDFFAKFGEQEMRRMRTAAARYVMGLGLLGQGQTEKAKREFEEAVKLNASHVWARYQLSLLR